MAEQQWSNNYNGGGQWNNTMRSGLFLKQFLFHHMFVFENPLTIPESENELINSLCLSLISLRSREQLISTLLSQHFASSSSLCHLLYVCRSRSLSADRHGWQGQHSRLRSGLAYSRRFLRLSTDGRVRHSQLTSIGCKLFLFFPFSDLFNVFCSEKNHALITLDRFFV